MINLLHTSVKDKLFLRETNHGLVAGGGSKETSDRIALVLNITIISLLLVSGFLVWKSQEARLNAYSEWYCSVIYGKNPDCSGNYTYSEGVNKND